MVINQYKPTGILSKFIRYYWSIEACANEPLHTERVLPLGNVDLMFHYKNSFLIQKEGKSVFRQSAANLGGLSTTFAHVSTAGETGMICVSFFPFGACHFFNLPLTEIAEQQIGLENIFRDTGEILDKIYCAGSMNERISFLESYLVSKIAYIGDYENLLMVKSIDLIEQSKGQISAFMLADKLALSPKSLERKFNYYIGKSPKQYSKIIRFKNILDQLKSPNQHSLTRIAIENGYFDQSHFTRDFKKFTGYSPRDFLNVFDDISGNDLQ